MNLTHTTNDPELIRRAFKARVSGELLIISDTIYGFVGQVVLHHDTFQWADILMRRPADHELEYRVKRHPDISFTTRNFAMIRRCLHMLHHCAKIHVNLPQWTGDTYVLKVNMRGDEADITVRPTGAPFVIPEGQHLLRLEANTLKVGDTVRIEGSGNFTIVPSTTKEQPVKIRNKYYVAAAKVTTPFEQEQDNNAKGAQAGRWTRHDLKDAISHAEQILEQNPSQDHVVVVKMIRVVRRKKAPVVVEVIA